MAFVLLTSPCCVPPSWRRPVPTCSHTLANCRMLKRRWLSGMPQLTPKAREIQKDEAIDAASGTAVPVHDRARHRKTIPPVSIVLTGENNTTERTKINMNFVDFVTLSCNFSFILWLFLWFLFIFTDFLTFFDFFRLLWFFSYYPDFVLTFDFFWLLFWFPWLFLTLLWLFDRCTMIFWDSTPSRYTDTLTFCIGSCQCQPELEAK